MDIAKYSAGTYTQQYQYKSFSPAPINVNWTWSDRKTHLLIEQANLKLGELNAFSLHMPDVDIFIQMHVVKEATTSSRIEGTLLLTISSRPSTRSWMVMAELGA